MSPLIRVCTVCHIIIFRVKKLSHFFPFYLKVALCSKGLESIIIQDLETRHIDVNPYSAEYSKLAPPLLNINYLTFYIGMFT